MAELEHQRLSAEAERLAGHAAQVPELELRSATARERLALLDLAEEDESLAASLRPRRDELREVALNRRSSSSTCASDGSRAWRASLAVALVEGDACPVCGALEHPRPASRTRCWPGTSASAEELLAEAERELHAVETRAAAHHQLRDAPTWSGAAGAQAWRRRVATRLDSSRPRRRPPVPTRRRSPGWLPPARSSTACAQSLAGVLAEAASLTALLTELADQARAGVQRLATPRERHSGCPCASGPCGASRLGSTREPRCRPVRLVCRPPAHRGRVGRRGAGCLLRRVPRPSTAREAVREPEDRERLRAEVTAHLEEVTACRSVPRTRTSSRPLPVTHRICPRWNARLAQPGGPAGRGGRPGTRRIAPCVASSGSAPWSTTPAGGRHRGGAGCPVQDLADTTSGTGPDNTLRMRLTAYVLASSAGDGGALATSASR